LTEIIEELDFEMKDCTIKLLGVIPLNTAIFNSLLISGASLMVANIKKIIDWTLETLK
jgi:hypothetical protein